MANQKATLKVMSARSKVPKDVRLTLVDTDATGSTFTDYGAGTTWVAEDDFLVVDCVGYGTTAPATALAFQFNVNGMDKPAFMVGAAIFDPKSTPQARTGAAFGQLIPRGSTVKIIGRA